MKIVVTRNMTVAGDDGKEQQFLRSPEPIEVSGAVGGRLVRAGAGREVSEDADTSGSSLNSGGERSNVASTGDGATIEANPDSDGTTTPDLSKLDDMTKDELLKFAEDHSISVKASDTKADIAEAIRKGVQPN